MILNLVLPQESPAEIEGDEDLDVEVEQVRHDVDPSLEAGGMKVKAKEVEVDKEG